MVRDEDRVLHPKKRCRLPIPLMFWNPPKKKYKEERKKSLEQETYIAKRFEERGFFWVRDRTLLLSIFYILFLQDINGNGERNRQVADMAKKSYPVVLWNPSGLRLLFSCHRHRWQVRKPPKNIYFPIYRRDLCLCVKRGECPLYLCMKRNGILEFSAACGFLMSECNILPSESQIFAF